MRRRIFAAAFCCTVVLGGIPPEWSEDEKSANLLYAVTDVDVKAQFMPAVGNGYIGTQIGSDSMFVSGVYNGIASETPSHRARIPSTVAFRGPGTVEHTSLNLREVRSQRMGLDRRSTMRNPSDLLSICGRQHTTAAATSPHTRMRGPASPPAAPGGVARRARAARRAPRRRGSSSAGTRIACSAQCSSTR